MKTPTSRALKLIPVCAILLVSLMASAIAHAYPISNADIVDGKQYGGRTGDEDDKIGGH